FHLHLFRTAYSQNASAWLFHAESTHFVEYIKYLSAQIRKKMKFIYPISSLLSLRKIRSLLSFGVKGYLAEIGWMEAYRARVPLDQNNQPLPWFTYSFIDFMEPRLSDTLHVFEYGSGYSTRYFSKRVATVTSAEHDREWLDAGMKVKADNVSLIHYEGV